MVEGVKAGAVVGTMALLVKGGTVVNDDEIFKADVLIKDGVIQAVGPDLKADGATVVDASGRYVIPGGIDPHTHMQLPFMGTVAADDFYHGTRAALAGGTTLVSFRHLIKTLADYRFCDSTQRRLPTRCLQAMARLG